MNSLTINTSSRSYPIYFERDFSALSKSIKLIDKNYTSYVIITDSNVQSLYVDIVTEEIKSLGEVLTVSFPAGEEHKNIQTISKFYEEMINFKADRNTLVIALGGGVTGDMAGFTAATYMRGVDFVQIPTSLLAQVDSSVGGKTGIDFNGYKNVVGAFYQPMFVFINVGTLRTLPFRELYAGMSEVVKHGFIKDKDYHNFLRDNVKGILDLDEELLIQMIQRSCEIKKSVVDEDEKEQGARALLNFGHTFGHSIERLMDFKLIHGECVAIGMHGGLTLSNQLGYLSDAELEESIQLIKAYKMPLTVKGLDKEAVYNELFHDKKTTSKRLVFALLRTIGDSFLNQDTIDEVTVKKCLDIIIEE
jgi:3-dehydroquinate synthase